MSTRHNADSKGVLCIFVTARGKSLHHCHLHIKELATGKLCACPNGQVCTSDAKFFVALDGNGSTVSPAKDRSSRTQANERTSFI